MNTLFQIPVRRALLPLLLLLFSAVAAAAQDPRLQTGSLDYLAGKASQTVDVNIDEHLMQMTAKFFSNTDPDEKKIKELISGLAVLATQPKELTVVNIIGPVDLSKLSELEGQFGVPELGIEQPAKAKIKN